MPKTTCSNENANLIYHGHGIAEPIGLEYLAGVLNANGYSDISLRSYIELEVKTSKLKGISFISAMTAEWNQALQVAKTAKKRGNVVVVGGYHVSGIIESGLNEYFDYIIVGEGESVIIEIIHEIENELELPCIPKIIKASQIENLDNLPLPYRSKKYLGKYLLYDLMYPAPSIQVNPGIVLASRGCQFSCDFCASASVWGSGLRLRSPEKVIEELWDLKIKYNSNMFVFIDQSFGQNEKWAFKLLKMIIDSNLHLNWYHQSNVTISNELIHAMAEAGCKKIGFGIEGISPSTIKFLKPVNFSSMDKINDKLDLCNELGIFTKAYLMLGFPWEDKVIINEYFENMPKLNANQIKLSFYTPFPGTKDWKKYSAKLITRNWDDFDTVKMPVVYNPDISVTEYQEIRSDLFNEFYTSHAYHSRTNAMLSKYPQYLESYREFIEYLVNFNMLKNVSSFDDFVMRYKKDNTLVYSEQI